MADRESVIKAIANIKKEPNKILGVILNKHPRRFFSAKKRRKSY